MRIWLFVLALVGCAGAPSRPTFEGRETDDWIAFDGDGSKFEAGALAIGCHVQSVPTGGDPPTEFIQVARCKEGRIASRWMMTLTGPPRWRIACERPTTRERCEDLLQKISVAGR